MVVKHSKMFCKDPIIAIGSLWWWYLWLRWWWWRSYGDCGGYSLIKGGSCKSLRSSGCGGTGCGFGDSIYKSIGGVVVVIMRMVWY